VAASLPRLLAAHPKPVPPVPSDAAEPDPLIGVSDPDSGLSGSGSGGAVEPPLTSEPPLVVAAPLTSEPPLAPEPPLTSEPTARAAAGTAPEPLVI
jgi:hypothetical protein